MNLKRLRKAIDSIDSKILGLLTRRARVTLEIGKLKSKLRSSIYVPDRETDVYRKLAAKNKGPLPGESIKAIFREIMSSSFRLEKPLTIAYLGPELTFTHIASMKKFGSSVNYISCETITDVFNEVEKSKADYGVVPIENSIEGAVNHTFDMFMESELKICSEIFMEVSHNLLSKEIKKDRVKKVYSKPEVFGQCRAWIEANLRGAELIETSSTARAAQIAAKTSSSACIASVQACARYKLKVLYRAIQDSPHNMTRFLVIGNTAAKPTRNDKTSIMVSIKDKIGALHDMLVPLKRDGINLTKIESRPSRIRAWEYYFFIDMEGHKDSPKISKAIKDLKKEAAYLKILGSYPAGDRV